MRVCVSAALACALLASGAGRADEWKSGPQVGEGGSGGFGAVFVNGEHAGKSRCPV